jgi:hypothetical protein
MNFPGIGLIVFALCVSAQPEQVKTVRFSGRVVNPLTKDAVPRANVRLYQPSGSGVKSYVVRSDGAGAFQAALPPGTYSVECNRTGYMAPDGMTGRTPTITLDLGDKPATITCSLIPAASIEGSVVDPDGQPAEGIYVGVERAIRGGDAASLYAAYSRPADASGRFRITGLPPGRYFLSATPTGQDFYLLSDGPPRAHLRTYYPGTPARKDAQAIAVRAGDVVQADIRLSSVAVVPVRGKYVDSDGKPKRAVVSVQQVDGIAGSISAVTGEDGSFEIEVPRGDWLLTGPPRDVSGQYEAILPLTVSGNAIDDLVLQAPEPAAIVGNLEYGGAASDATSKIRVILKHSTTGLHAGDLDFGGPLAFQFTDLLPGRYGFEIENRGCDCYLSTIFLDGQPIQGMELDLAPASRNQATLRFERPAGRIEGTVEGAPDADVLSSLVAFALPVGQRSGQYLAVPLSQVGDDRKFSFRDLRPGAYRVWVMVNLDQIYLTDPQFVDDIEKSAKTVVVKAGEQSSIEVPVTPRPY